MKLIGQNHQPIAALGAQRFLELEQKVSDIEKILELMRELVQANNASLQSILEAIERENGKASN
jgi:hypothetical protein